MLNKGFNSGYLCFTLKQLLQIVIASVLLVVTLGVINYLNVLDTSEVLEKLGGAWELVLSQLRVINEQTGKCASGTWRIVANSVTSFLSLFGSS